MGKSHSAKSVKGRRERSFNEEKIVNIQGKYT
jgi:hypothetical protein